MLEHLLIKDESVGELVINYDGLRRYTNGTVCDAVLDRFGRDGRVDGCKMAGLARNVQCVYLRKGKTWYSFIWQKKKKELLIYETQDEFRTRKPVIGYRVLVGAGADPDGGQGPDPEGEQGEANP